MIVICAYALLYVALNWFSLAQGLRCAPALFVAGVIPDGLVGGFPLGIQSTIVSELIVAAGYTGVAAALRRFTHADQGFPRVADVVWLLLVVDAGTFGVACLVVTELRMMHELPPDLTVPSIRHFCIGDLTGIVGLLPVLLTISQAWD